MEDQIQIISDSIINDIRDLKPLKIKDQASDVIHTIFYSKKLGISSVGSDYEEEKSFYKARHEFIERLIFYKLKGQVESTSGLAAHFSDKQAKASSFKELVERDLFLTSWFRGEFPYWETPLNKDFPFQMFNQKFDIKIGHIGYSGDLHCYVFIVTDKKQNFGSICGTVCEKKADEAVKKIIFDISRINLFPKNHFDDFDSTIKPSFHLNYYLNIKNKYIRKTYLNRSSPPITLDINSYQFTLFRFNLSTLKPLSIALCSSQDVQPYFSGAAIESKLNRKRIPHSIHPDRLIHPLG